MGMGQFAESLVVAGLARAGWPARKQACRNAKSPMQCMWSSPPSPTSSPGPSNHPARAGCESWPPSTWKCESRWRPLHSRRRCGRPGQPAVGRPARGAAGNAQDQFAAQVRKSVAGVPDMTRSTRSGSSNLNRHPHGLCPGRWLRPHNCTALGARPTTSTSHRSWGHALMRELVDVGVELGVVGVSQQFLEPG